VTDIKIPELGENVAGGDVLRVLVNVGDAITKDQPVVELETDKATIEVPTSMAGTVKEIKVKPGDKVKVGSVLLTLDEAAGNGAEKAAAAEPTPRSQDPTPKAPEPKAESPKPRADDQKVVSMPRPNRPEPAPAQAARPEPVKPASSASRGPAAPAAPSVRRLAREIGVDVNEVQGSGAEGRISEEDVKEHARRILSSVGTATGGGGQAPGGGLPLPDFERWGDVERQPMSNIRRTTSQRLSHAWNAIPHVTQFDKADITAMEELRKKYRESIKKMGGDLTVTVMLVKVLAVAVKQFPQFNSSLDLQHESIIFKKYVNVGIAVDTDRGLLVPVIRNADQKNISEIAVEVQELAQKARDRKLSLEEMSGGGITISNLGGIGGTYFTPIVNWPEVAILGVSRGVIEPVHRPSASSGQGPFEPRQMLPLSLSYDHRVIDGADAMRFLRWVVEAIEQPFLLSLLG
jgi:pyruvate dehydrogenase E2 component (dihydrolipoamide acetyltransferase)